MSESDQRGEFHHDELGFEESIAAAFGILGEYGFTPIGSDNVSAHFESECARLAIRHGRSSHELSLQLARTDHPDELAHPYSMQDLIRAVDRDRGNRYRNFAASSRDAVSQGLRQLADDLVQYGDRALRCEPESFAAMQRERVVAIENLARASQRAREDAAVLEAFDQQDWDRVIRAYEERAGSLSRLELKRLEIARGRAQRE
jgi:hypothetical protein